ncbi:hypothetical protein HUT18_06460 [Streptomyces sp. NA04227]|uniref:hypothetical protein n=1 Tax=Streptomyces sp. NA04227 TaxID=2742136 RepID=UPI00158FE9CB|nr:hypothetical protein [Streptomyces sp. NA04227]QKW06096.1 hypothetical protein HUT18_06460 [Streptomyces sp. NA04227]
MLNRRRFLAITALATAVGAAPLALSSANATSLPLELTAYIDGRAVDRTTVLEWEARRLQVVAARIGDEVPSLLAELAVIVGPDPSAENVEQDRQLLADVKLRMGESRIRELLAPDIAITDPMSAAAAALGDWDVSTIEISSSLGTAQGFVDWFNARIARNDVRAMLVACPDHYVLNSPRAGVQEVIEVTGGAVLGSRFFVDYSDRTGVPIETDPAFPVRTAGWARNSDGTKIGAVRHQFRDTPGGGFRAKPAVAFPAALPPGMISAHEWHLACEFSNWMTAYVDSLHA